MKTFVFYHGSDLDGHCSGAIARMYLEDSGVQDIIMRPVEYGQTISPDEVAGAAVYMLDWWPGIENFREVCEVANSVAWIDHHKTAISEFENSFSANNYSEAKILNVVANYSTEKSACEIAWESFFWIFELRFPQAVRLLGRYDVWDHASPDVLPFQYAMRSLDTDPDTDEAMRLWRDVFKYDAGAIASMCETGEGIIRYLDKTSAVAAVAMAEPFAFKLPDGTMIEGMAYNQRKANQDAFRVHARNHGARFILSYWRNSARQWVHSLYRLNDGDDLDLSAIAKSYGGGGHSGAAGFTLAYPLVSLPSSIKQMQRGLHALEVSRGN